MNLKKVYLVAGITIIWFPLSSIILQRFFGQFLQANSWIIVFCFIPQFIFLITWILTQKTKDIFVLSHTGIESQKHGIIKWDDIEFCSWESYRGAISVTIKLKNRHRFTISPLKIWRKYSEGYTELRNFFNELSEFQKVNKFQVYENRFSNLFTTIMVAITVIIFLALVIYFSTNS